jgi:hypothetical protein
MGFDDKILVARVVNTFAKSKALLARYVGRFIEARRRRIEHEREFYRDLRAYCRANKVPPVCQDDWKTTG